MPTSVVFIIRLLFVILCFHLLLACEKESKAFDLSTFHKIETPCMSGGESRFYQDNSGRLWMSWVEYLTDTSSALMITHRKDDQWAKPVEIAQGNDWFVNWADFPAISGTKNKPNYLLAHWLQKSQSGTYDYDIMISTSNNAGKTWTTGFKLHQDTVAAEHGFVSFVAEDDNTFATWLDGRRTKFKGPMTLRAATIGQYENTVDTFLLDDRVCDCCQTAAVAHSNWRLVAYRDRSVDEHRDISLVRFVDGAWSKPYTPHADGWKIAGCPVNGPALANHGNHVALAWFTGVEEGGNNYITFSTDGGVSFGEKIQLNNGSTLGRVHIEMLDKKSALALWMEPFEEKAELFLQEVHMDSSKGELYSLGKVSASRSTGFPQIAITDQSIFISYTEVKDDGQRVVVLSSNGS